jgi:hypothetical protein
MGISMCSLSIAVKVQFNKYKELFKFKAIRNQANENKIHITFFIKYLRICAKFDNRSIS